MYQAGLRAMGAGVPAHQAPAITMDELHKVFAALLDDNVVRNSRRAATLLFLAFKTASRWDEVSRLTRQQFLEVNAQRIIIYWGGNTKTTRMTPYRTDSWVVIEHEMPIPQFVLETIAGMQGTEPLLGHTSDWGNTLFKRVLGSKTAVTCHSIKAAAVSKLVLEVVAGNLEERMVSRVAKHEPSSLMSTGLQTTTLRYARDQVALALALKTQEATRLLKFN